MNYNSDDSKKKSGGVATALGAAVVGAALGAAVTYLSDKQKRDQVAKKLNDATNTAKNKTTDLLSKAADSAGSALEDAGKKVKNSKNKLGDVTDTVQDEYDSTTTI
jgi:gas vesicle protein